VTVTPDRSWYPDIYFDQSQWTLINHVSISAPKNTFSRCYTYLLYSFLDTWLRARTNHVSCVCSHDDPAATICITSTSSQLAQWQLLHLSLFKSKAVLLGTRLVHKARMIRQLEVSIQNIQCSKSHTRRSSNSSLH
jgi:hypothetical protein